MSDQDTSHNKSTAVQWTQLREEWLRRIVEARLLTAMSREEFYAEATSIYDQYVEAARNSVSSGERRGQPVPGPAASGCAREKRRTA